MSEENTELANTQSKNDNPNEEELFPIKINKKDDYLTKPMFAMSKRHWMIFEFFLFGVNLASAMDRQAMIAAEALAHSGSDKDAERLQKQKENADAALKKLTSFANYSSEDMSIRLVDNFLCYLTDIIKACAVAKPEMLRSNEMVKVEDILKCKNYDEVLNVLVERKINELSYGGIVGMGDFLLSRTGLSLWSNQAEKALLNAAVEIRNIYTHNRGIVNDTTMRRMSKDELPFEFVINKRFHADFENITLIANNLFQIAFRLDNAASEKFGLERFEMQHWKANSR